MSCAASAFSIRSSLDSAPSEIGSFELDEVGDGRSEVTCPREVLIPRSGASHALGYGSRCGGTRALKLTGGFLSEAVADDVGSDLGRRSGLVTSERPIHKPTRPSPTALQLCLRPCFVKLSPSSVLLPISLPAPLCPVISPAVLGESVAALTAERAAGLLLISSSSSSIPVPEPA